MSLYTAVGVSLYGPVNLVDNDTHIVGLAIQHSIPAGPLFATPIQWSLYGQWHRWVSREAKKADASHIGAPGYHLSGGAYSYGVSLSADL